MSNLKFLQWQDASLSASQSSKIDFLEIFCNVKVVEANFTEKIVVENDCICERCSS